jgi:hypothetical protein
VDVPPLPWRLGCFQDGPVHDLRTPLLQVEANMTVSKCAGEATKVAYTYLSL